MQWEASSSFKVRPHQTEGARSKFRDDDKVVEVRSDWPRPIRRLSVRGLEFLCEGSVGHAREGAAKYVWILDFVFHSFCSARNQRLQELRNQGMAMVLAQQQQKNDTELVKTLQPCVQTAGPAVDSVS